MKRTTKKSTTQVIMGPNSNLFNLEFDEFPNSKYLINTVDLNINTGFMGDEKLLTLKFTCLENENMESYDFFVPLMLSKELTSAALSIYGSNGVLLKDILMDVEILEFNKSLSWDNKSTISYFIEARFKFVN